ncbi:SDR family oxidoreductase [Dactylosporangium aurantiacum]|uniref:SDR family oxidoreductase n=1 Tax=Dactylosporangium aurantiacum TaxID=35754 RepID=UPI0036C03561
MTARRPAELREWAEPYGDRVLVLQLDVTDAEQVRAAVTTAEERFGGIDVLVNNAGRGWFGSVEGAPDETPTCRWSRASRRRSWTMTASRRVTLCAEYGP